MSRDEIDPDRRSRTVQTPSPADDPRAWFQAAVDAYRSGDLDGAARLLQRGPAGDRQAIDLQISLADALADAGRSIEAVAAYRKALAACPRDAIAHHNLAAALLQLGQFDGAIEHCRAASDARPNYNALAHNTLGVALACAVGMSRPATRCKPHWRSSPISPKRLTISDRSSTTWAGPSKP